MNTFFRTSLLVLLALLAPLSLAEDTPETIIENAQAPVIDKININTANEAELAQSLSGVGLVKARAIVAYRNTYGPFASVEELVEVKGIGKGLIERNRERIVTQ